MDATLEIKAAQNILQKGVEIIIPAPFFMRLFRKKTLKLKIGMPSAGLSLRVIERRLKMNITDDELADLTVDKALALQVKHSYDVAYMVALLVLGGKKRGWFARPLASYLLNKMPFATLLDIMTVATLGGGVEDFINTIRLTRLLRLTMPNQSQTAQGS